MSSYNNTTNPNIDPALGRRLGPDEILQSRVSELDVATGLATAIAVYVSPQELPVKPVEEGATVSTVGPLRVGEIDLEATRQAVLEATGSQN